VISILDIYLKYLRTGECTEEEYLYWRRASLNNSPIDFYIGRNISRTFKKISHHGYISNSIDEAMSPRPFEKEIGENNIQKFKEDGYISLGVIEKQYIEKLSMDIQSIVGSKIVKE